MNGFAVKVDGTGWRRVAGPGEIDPATEYFMLDEGVEPPAPVASAAEIIAAAQAEVVRRMVIANDQVALIRGRIEALEDAVELGSATAAEVAELPGRQAQLLSWRVYRIDLGRVPTSAGWPPAPTWPTQPALYVPS